MDGCMGGRTDGWVGRWVGGWMYGWMDRRTGGWMNEWTDGRVDGWMEYSIVWMDHSLVIHSPMKGHLGCFWILVIINKAAVNICADFCVDSCIQLIWVNSSSETAGSYGKSMLNIQCMFMHVSLLNDSVRRWIHCPSENMANIYWAPTVSQEVFLCFSPFISMLLIQMISCHPHETTTATHDIGVISSILQRRKLRVGEIK